MPKSKFKQIVIYVPPEWKELLEKRAKQLFYNSVSEYVRSLIRDDLIKSGLLQ